MDTLLCSRHKPKQNTGRYRIEDHSAVCQNAKKETIIHIQDMKIFPADRSETY